MDDDFNTSEALAALQGLTREINTARDAADAQRAAELGDELKSLGNVLGLLTVAPEEWFRLGRPAGAAAGDQLSDDEVEVRIAARKLARARRDFAESDRIRDELAAVGVLLEDKPGGETRWRRA